MGKIENDLFGAVETIARQVVEKNGADITVRGEVIRTANVEVGEYKVRYEGNTWSAFAQSPTIVYDQGDEVYVLIPEANFNNKKIILGHAAYENNSTNSDLTEMTNKYVPMGPNWLSENWYSGSLKNLNITAAQDLNGEDDERSQLVPGAVGEVPEKEEHGWFSNFGFVRTEEQLQKLQSDERNPYLTYGKENGVQQMAADRIKTVDQLLQGYSATADYLKIKADFRTDFTEVHSYGEYYLAVQVIEAGAELKSLQLRIDDLNKSKEFATEEELKWIEEQVTSLEQEKVKVEKEKPYEITEYRLGFGHFTSQPYGLPLNTPQVAYLPIVPGSVKGLYAIYLGQDGNMVMDREAKITDEGRPYYDNETKTKDRPNIFASNIEVQFMHKVNLLDNLYYSFIETPQGDRVYAKPAGQSVDLKARLFYGYQDVLNEQDCAVYWFREDPRIADIGFYNAKEAELYRPPEVEEPNPKIMIEPTKEQYPAEEDYKKAMASYQQFLDWTKYRSWEGFKDEQGRSLYDYSGPGWIPVQWINDQIIKDHEDYDNKILYGINFDTLTVKYRQVPMQWRYKAVIVYKGDRRTTTDPIATIYRDDTQLNFGLKEIIDDEVHKMYLQVYDFNEPQDKFISITKPDGSKEYLNEYYPEEVAQWYLTKNENVCNEITSEYEYSRDVDRPIEAKGFLDKTSIPGITVLEGPKQIAPYLITPILTFTASVYLKSDNPAWENSLVDWPKDEPVAAISHQVISEKDLDLLVEWEGQDTFIYNSDGTVMNAQDKPNHTLTYKLNWPNGTQQAFTVDVLGPERKVLTQNTQTSSEKSMMTNFCITESGVINFLIRQKFDKYKDQNYFIVRITSSMTGKVWEVRKDLVFIKNGEQGSNGTDWFAPIYPCHFDSKNSNMVAFSSPVLSEEMPIRLKAEAKEDGGDNQNWSWDWKTAKQVEDNISVIADNGAVIKGNYNHLILRPFVTKGGININEVKESIPIPDNPTEFETRTYKYDVFWDVRYPENSLMSTDLSGNSCLRLKRITLGNNNEVVFGNYFDKNVADEDVSTEVKDYGLVGITHYSGDNSKEKLYGAVEVVYHAENDPKTEAPWIDPSIANYNFYVKATIDIYEHRVHKNSDGIVIKEVNSLVATLTSYYPVDILMQEIKKDSSQSFVEEFNNKNLSINWPKDIKYNVTGYQPQAWTDRLKLNYMVQDAAKHSVEIMPPINNTPRLIELNETELTKLDNYGNIVRLGEYEYTLRPRPYNIWLDNHHPEISNQFEIIGATREMQTTAAYDQLLAERNNFIQNKNHGLYASDINYKNWYDEREQAYEKGLDNEEDAIYNENKELKYNNTNPTLKPVSPPANISGAIVTYEIKRDEIKPPKDKYEYFRTIITVLDIYGGNMSINGWDGTRIDINEDKGTIFAPTIGAGYKHPYTNTFTGVLMGIDTSQVKSGEDANYARFPEKELDKNKYMVGLYGYQDGVSSFGIMENGTAFFGRADRGGRIVIDGYNAQIYGGMNGETGTEIGGNRDMDMTNRMRLSFIDFENLAWNHNMEDTDETEKKFLNTDGININLGAFNVQDFQQYFSNSDSNVPIMAKVAGFGSGRGYSTPAIEIGSYKSYMEGHPNRKGSDLIRELTISDIKNFYSSIQDLEIPGYRKFLVTYDGTLYAMNAFIKGNLVSSNIIGSQFFNANGTFAVTEYGNLGIGKDSTELYEWIVDTEDSTETLKKKWSRKIPKLKVSYLSNYFSGNALKDFQRGDYNFFVSNKGVVTCKEIHIAGGSLDIGDFHIIGSNSKYRPGDVVSYGTMYLIGAKPTLPTKIQDGATTTDALPDGIDRAVALEGWGNLHLRGRIVNLGQVLLGGGPEKIAPTKNTMPYGAHITEIEEGEEIKSFYATTYNSPFSITSKYIKASVEGSTETKRMKQVEGALWPLYLYSEFPASYEEGDLQPGWDSYGWISLAHGSTDLDQTNGYTLQFAIRPQGKVEQGEINHPILPKGVSPEEVQLSGIANWRVDSNGMWSDAILLRRNIQGLSNFEKIAPKEKMQKAEGLIGFITGNDGTNKTVNMGIRNMSLDAPSIVLEAPRNIRLSTGVTPLDTGGEHDIMLDANWVNQKNKVVRSAFIRAQGAGRKIEMKSLGVLIHKGDLTNDPDNPTDKTLENAVFEIKDYDADHQIGIYARFG